MGVVRILALALAALAVVVVAAGVSTSSPAVCASCHGALSNGLKSSPHSQQTCYDCHLENGWWDWVGHKALEITVMYPARMTNPKALPRGGSSLSRKPCMRCHQEIAQGITKAGGLRIRHGSCAVPPVSCLNCHGSVSHNEATRWIRQPIMEECVLCHREAKADRECDTCHEGQLERDRLVKGPWQVTHGKNWRDMHGMGRLSYCGTCHPTDYCVRCHDVTLPHESNFGNTHGTRSLRPTSKCYDCHDKKTFCTACHKIEMPHGTSFLKRHSSIATSRTDERCGKCHEQSDCKRCHAQHTHPGRADGDFPGGVR